MLVGGTALFLGMCTLCTSAKGSQEPLDEQSDDTCKLYLQGTQCKENQDYESAFKYYQDVVCQSNVKDEPYVKACYELGLLYKEAKGVTRDFKKAQMYFSKAFEVHPSPAISSELAGVTWTVDGGLKASVYINCTRKMLEEKEPLAAILHECNQGLKISTFKNKHNKNWNSLKVDDTPFLRTLLVEAKRAEGDDPEHKTITLAQANERERTLCKPEPLTNLGEIGKGGGEYGSKS